MFANDFGSFRNVECGLVCRVGNGNGFQPVPLVSVAVTASVVHAVAQVEILQVYRNIENVALETVYFFPVDSNGAVTHFQAEMNGQVIKGIVKSQEDAKQEYEKAVKNHKTAFLGEENKPDIFKVSVGNLPPGTEVKVRIGYVTEVKNEPDSHAMRFFIPTVVAPRYTPAASGVYEGTRKSKLAKMQSSISSNSNSVPMSIKVIVSIQGEIKEIKSHTHSIVTENTGPIPNNLNWHKWIVTLDGNTTQMDRDFVILVTPKEPFKPRLYSETLEDGSLAVMAHLIPSFKLTDQKVELIVVLDRSGSMSGGSIKMAQKALMLFVHSLPEDCYFNIIGFGSSFKSLFSKGSEKYSEKSLSLAKSYAERLKADMGGTEIMEPLIKIYSTSGIKGYLRQLFVITDGQVSNTEEILGLVKRNSHQARVFALGIGGSASHHLVDGLSQAGGGSCAFVESDENIQKQTLSQLKNALQPALSEVNVKWSGIPTETEPSPKEIEVPVNKTKTLFGYNKPLNQAEPSSSLSPVVCVQAPAKIPPVFDGSQMIVLGVFTTDLKPTGAVITALSPDGPLSLDLELYVENDVGSTKMLHRLAAIKRVRELELEEADMVTALKPRSSGCSIKEEIIALSIKNGITSKYTSFIAVNETEKSDKGSWGVQTRYVQQDYEDDEDFNPTSPQQRRRCAPRRLLATRAGRGGSGGCGGFSFTPTPMDDDDDDDNEDDDDDNDDDDDDNDDDDDENDDIDISKMDDNEDIQEECFAVSVKPETGLDLVHSLVKLQTFQGYFTLSEEFCKLLGTDIEALKAETAKNGWDESAFTTALAVVFLREKMGEWKDYWELVVAKAEKWTDKNFAANKIAMDSAATQLVGGLNA